MSHEIGKLEEKKEMNKKHLVVLPLRKKTMFLCDIVDIQTSFFLPPTIIRFLFFSRTHEPIIFAVRWLKKKHYFGEYAVATNGCRQ